MTADSATASHAPAQANEFSTNYKIYVLALLVLVYVSNYTDRVLLGILLPSIKREFDLSYIEVGLLNGTMFAIFYATLGIPIALYADRGNRKFVIVAATTVWSFMTALCAVTTSFWQLALTRIGVGVGEAGSGPPSHSVIADLFSIKARSTALAIFSQGVSLGLVLGIYGGAQVAAHWALRTDYFVLEGWRMAFVVMGLPGLFIAALVWLTFREPARGASEGRVLTGDAPPLSATIAFIRSQPALVHVLAGATLTTLVGYTGVLWWPLFIVNSHGMSPESMSSFLALVFGLGSGFGIFLGGFCADWYGRRDIKMIPRVVALAILVGLPFGAAIYLVDDSAWVFLLIGIPAATGGFYLGPSMALVQSLVAVRMRTVASALLLFVINIIGMGLGSLMVGALTQALEPALGLHALRYALLTFMAFNLWAAVHYWRAGAFMAGGLKRAMEASA
jgi:predicted MFS family arabinose efflux permease